MQYSTYRPSGYRFVKLLRRFKAIPYGMLHFHSVFGKHTQKNNNNDTLNVHGKEMYTR